MARPHESCALTQASLYPNRKIPPRPSSDSEAIPEPVPVFGITVGLGEALLYRSVGSSSHAWHGTSANNIGRQSQILSLLGAPVFASVIRQDPIFLFKYLTRDYLARGLSSRARAESFLRHYRRLRDVLPGPVLSGILHRPRRPSRKRIGRPRFSGASGARPRGAQGRRTCSGA